MSINERLSEIEAVAAWLDDKDMEPEVYAATAAIRAVLDVCAASLIEARPTDGSEPYMVVRADEIRDAIATALGEAGQ